MGLHVGASTLSFNRLWGGRFSEHQNVSYTKWKYLLVNINCQCKKWNFVKNSATECFYCYFSICPSQFQTFSRVDSCSSAKTLAGSEALSAEDAVSLSLPYSAEMLWQSISQGDAVSMATPHCKISKLDFFFFFWEVQEQGRNEAICQRARLEKRKPCPLILQPWLLCVLISECYYGREHGLLTLLWVFEGFFLFVSLFISPIKKKKKRRLGGWEEALLEL